VLTTCDRTSPDIKMYSTTTYYKVIFFATLDFSATLSLIRKFFIDLPFIYLKSKSETDVDLCSRVLVAVCKCFHYVPTVTGANQKNVEFICHII